MLVLPRQRTRQPSGTSRIDRSNALGRTVTHCIPLNGVNKEIVRGTTLVITSTGSMRADSRELSLRGDGSNACASIPLDLSAYNKLSLSFSMYWDTFANDDDMAIEFTSNFSSGGGFAVLPNYSPGFFLFGAGVSGSNSSKYFTRPAAAQWLRYTFLLHRTLSGSAGVAAVAAYVNGAPQSLTGIGSSSTGGNFTSDTLYLFSRNNNNLFGAGRLQDIVIRGGYLMSAVEAAVDARNPWQIYAPMPGRLRLGVFSAPPVGTLGQFDPELRIEAWF